MKQTVFLMNGYYKKPQVTDIKIEKKAKNITFLLETIPA